MPLSPRVLRLLDSGSAYATARAYSSSAGVAHYGAAACPTSLDHHLES